MSDAIYRSKSKTVKKKDNNEEQIIEVNISSFSDEISQSKNNNLEDDEKELSLKNLNIIKNLNANLKENQISKLNSFKRNNSISSHSNSFVQENIDHENMVINIEDPQNSPDLILSRDLRINKNYKEDKSSSLIKMSEGQKTLKKENTFLNENEENNPSIFFFINKFAGEEKGKILLNMGIEKMEFKGELQVNTYFFDMDDTEEKGIKIIELEILKNKIVKVIICGEDNSIYKFINKLYIKNLDLEKIIFGVLPIGHLNDISRQLGFGNYCDLNSDIMKIRNIVKELNEAYTTTIDIWDIKLTCDSKEGGIIFNEENKKIFKKNNNGDKLTTLRHGFIGYFSLGYDGRIGFGISKKKTKYRLCNKIFLLWEKMKKCICQKTIKLKGFIDSFYVINLPKDDFNNSIDCETDCTAMEDEGRKIPIFQTKNVETDNQNYSQNDSDYCDIDDSLKTFQYKKIVLKGDPIGLVCQNIQYFFHGEQSDWSLKNQKYGIETYEMIDSKDKNAKEVNFLFFNLLNQNYSRK